MRRVDRGETVSEAMGAHDLSKYKLPKRIGGHRRCKSYLCGKKRDKSVGGTVSESEKRVENAQSFLVCGREEVGEEVELTIWDRHVGRAGRIRSRANFLDVANSR